METHDSSPPRPETARKTVLIVEDDSRLRKIEAFTLANLGYHVLQACDFAEGLKFATCKEEIHLLLTDFHMPGGNGMELARKFRTVHPKTPVLLVTGMLRTVFGSAYGMDRFEILPKPFTFDELVGKVNALLAKEGVLDHSE